MRLIRAAKYLFAFTIPLSAFVSFTSYGVWSFWPLIYAFLIVPFLELVLGGSAKNLSKLEAEVISKDKLYDWVIYLMLPLQYVFVVWFLFSINEPGLDTISLVGRITALGVLCGVMGINVGHELGHRRTKWEQNMAKALLLSSLYPHFFIEHNYGHHKNVATPEDAASARYGESLFAFWFRSVINSYLSAWRIQKQMLKSRKVGFWSVKNEMLIYSILEVVLLVGIAVVFNGFSAMAFAVSALLGILLLETVNYIEHYGLERKKVSEFRYEKASPEHSWNSDHYIGRLVLFELTRHSDHHANPHKKYQVLEHYDESPQLPTGYPGMMLLSAIPPLWFKVMNPKCRQAA